jgi:hypothetical protein
VPDCCPRALLPAPWNDSGTSRDDVLAIHDRREGHVPGFAGRLQPGQLLHDPTGAHEAQLDLFLDYASNVDMYPKFQEHFRQHQPPLAVWGNGDPFFCPPAQRLSSVTSRTRRSRSLTRDTSLSRRCDEIAVAIRDFLQGDGVRAPRRDETLREA